MAAEPDPTGYTMPIPEAIVNLVNRGELTWEEVETAVTTTYQIIIDDVWMRRQVVALEQVFPSALNSGYSEEEMRKVHFYFIAHLYRSLADPVREQLQTGDVQGAIHYLLSNIIIMAPPEITQWVINREIYFAALFHIVIGMVTNPCKRDGESESQRPEGGLSAVMLVDHQTWSTIIQTEGGGVYIVTVVEGDRSAIVRGFEHILTQRSYYMGFVPEGRDVVTALVLPFLGNDVAEAVEQDFLSMVANDIAGS